MLWPIVLVRPLKQQLLTLGIPQDPFLNPFRLILLNQLSQRFKDPLTGRFLLKPHHILLVLVHEPKAEPALVLKVLLGHFEQPDLELVVIGLFAGLFLHVEEGRVAADVALGPDGEGFLLLDVGLGVREVDNDLLPAEAFDDAHEQHGLAVCVALLE
jgi:hypothetical protein